MAKTGKGQAHKPKGVRSADGMASGGQASLLSGRLSEKMDPSLAEASVSINTDSVLATYDIVGSAAHARMLAEAGLVSEGELKVILQGLKTLFSMTVRKKITWLDSLEDIHMNVEHALTQLIGPPGGKLHTARSRNDQVALDMRLILLDVIATMKNGLLSLRKAFVSRAKEAGLAPMPGYTHLQRAQPVLLAHHLMAYYHMFTRDWRRLDGLIADNKVMPLGSGALAGTGLPILPQVVADLLAFDSLAPNSIDAVASRDHMMEFLAFAAILMVHVSRLSEEIILWTTAEFGFAALPDSLSTTSSMMPQKKNPDGAELARGKFGRVIGHLVSLLSTVKGLPLSYNRDLQEDKEPVFDTFDTLLKVLPLVTKMVEGLKFNLGRLREAADDPYVAATDLADHLVLKGLPFREAHRAVGALVSHLMAEGRSILEVDPETLRKFCPLADPWIVKFLDVDSLIAARDSVPGGTGPLLVKLQIDEASDTLSSQDRDYSLDSPMSYENVCRVLGFGPDYKYFSPN